MFRFFQSLNWFVIIRELNYVAGEPSDRASPWTMDEEHKVPQAVKFSFPIL